MHSRMQQCSYRATNGIFSIVMLLLFVLIIVFWLEGTQETVSYMTLQTLCHQFTFLSVILKFLERCLFLLVML